MPSTLTRDYIQSVVANPNLVVRNLQVTQGYYRLSQGLRRAISGSNVSWCSFATHASKTAGQAIRHELMPKILKSASIRMAGYADTFAFLQQGLGNPDAANDNRLAEALRSVSLLVSDGNTIVFAELAWPLADFITSFYKDWTYDLIKLKDFLDRHLKPGPLKDGGQDFLREALSAYYQARFETEPRLKAERVLHGNLLIGLHEQTRLQPQIERSMAVPLKMLSEKGERSGIARTSLSKAVTHMLMSITLPSRELKLGQNVVAPTGVTNFPKELLTIENPRCLQLVRRFETGQDTLSGSAAKNWAELSDRMSFVVDFFRSHQQYARMWEQPFLVEQVPVIESGHFPAGPL
jgi:hypothetical protein